jgi:hypothetical protein
VSYNKTKGKKFEILGRFGPDSIRYEAETLFQENLDPLKVVVESVEHCGSPRN